MKIDTFAQKEPSKKDADNRIGALIALYPKLFRPIKGSSKLSNTLSPEARAALDSFEPTIESNGG